MPLTEVTSSTSHFEKRLEPIFSHLQHCVNIHPKSETKRQRAHVDDKGSVRYLSFQVSD